MVQAHFKEIAHTIHHVIAADREPIKHRCHIKACNSLLPPICHHVTSCDSGGRHSSVIHPIPMLLFHHKHKPYEKELIPLPIHGYSHVFGHYGKYQMIEHMNN